MREMQISFAYKLTMQTNFKAWSMKIFADEIIEDFPWYYNQFHIFSEQQTHSRLLFWNTSK